VAHVATQCLRATAGERLDTAKTAVSKKDLSFIQFILITVVSAFAGKDTHFKLKRVKLECSRR
jgi:hypothetical protein